MAATSLQSRTDPVEAVVTHSDPTAPRDHSLPETSREKELAALGAAAPLSDLPESADRGLEHRAKEAYEAMHGGMWGTGTDEDRLLKALEGLTAEDAARLRAHYADHYGRDLVADLDGELSGTDLSTAHSALRGDSVDATATRIERALSGAGTSEETIYEALEGKSPEDVAAIAAAYQARTGRTLEADLKGDLSGSELERAEALLRSDSIGAKVAQLIGAIDGAGTDEVVINDVLRDLTPAERAAVEHAYRERTGRELKTDLSDDLSGAELAESLALAEGRAADAGAASLRQAIEGSGTNEDAIYAAFEGKSKTEREAIVAAYEKNYGADLLKDLAADLDSVDLQKANLLIANGNLTDAEKIYFAVTGAGSDEETIRETLAGKSAAEIAAIRAEYAKLDAGGLDAALQSDLGGRDEFDAFQDLKGDPTTIQEKLERLHEKRSFEKSGILSGVVDTVTDKDERLEHAIQRLQTEISLAQADGVITADEQSRLDQLARYGKDDAQSYVDAKNTVADTAATVAATAAATVAVVGTAGMATPVVVAAAAAAGAAAYTGAKVGIQGAAYDGQDVGADIAVGGVEGTVTALTMGTGKAALEAAKQTGKQTLKDGIEQAVKSGAKEVTEEAAQQAGGRTLRHVGAQIGKDGAAGGAAGDGARAISSDKTWDTGFVAGLGEVVVTTAIGAAAGSVGEAAVIGAGRIIPRRVAGSGATPEVNSPTAAPHTDLRPGEHTTLAAQPGDSVRVALPPKTGLNGPVSPIPPAGVVAATEVAASGPAKQGLGRFRPNPPSNRAGYLRNPVIEVAEAARRYWVRMKEYGLEDPKNNWAYQNHPQTSFHHKVMKFLKENQGGRTNELPDKLQFKAAGIVIKVEPFKNAKDWVSHITKKIDSDFKPNKDRIYRFYLKNCEDSTEAVKGVYYWDFTEQAWVITGTKFTKPIKGGKKL